jgi:hypothetical protein
MTLSAVVLRERDIRPCAHEIAVAEAVESGDFHTISTKTVPGRHLNAIEEWQ